MEQEHSSRPISHATTEASVGTSMSDNQRTDLKVSSEARVRMMPACNGADMTTTPTR